MSRYTFHVITSTAARKGSFGKYGNVAVLRVDTRERGEGYVPTRIRELRGVEIVWARRRLNVGGPRSAQALALAEAVDLAASLRAEEDRLAAERVSAEVQRCASLRDSIRRLRALEVAPVENLAALNVWVPDGLGSASEEFIAGLRETWRWAAAQLEKEIG